MSFLIDYIKGIFIGAGAILPGISSGVFCVIFGIYEKLVNSVLELKNNFKENFLFLLPIGLGGITGVFIFGKLLNYFLTYFPMPTKSVFIGLIIGSIPLLFKQANKKTGFRLHYMIYLLFAFGIGILSIKLENILPLLISTHNNNIFYLILSGFAMSCGIVVPGVSSTVILMSLGVYSIYLQAISNIDFSVLVPMGIGIIIGCIIFLKLIQICFKKYYVQTFYCIIGFVLGSILVLYPNYSFNLQSIISVFLLILGFMVGLKLDKLENS